MFYAFRTMKEASFQMSTLNTISGNKLFINCSKKKKNFIKRKKKEFNGIFKHV